MQSRLESIRVDTGRGSGPDVLAPRNRENSESSKRYESFQLGLNAVDRSLIRIGEIFF